MVNTYTFNYMQVYVNSCTITYGKGCGTLVVPLNCSRSKSKCLQRAPTVKRDLSRAALVAASAMLFVPS